MSPNRHQNGFRLLGWAAFGLIALFVAAIGLTVWALREDAIRDADNDTGNIAIVLSGQIARSIQSVDIVMSDVRDQAQGRGPQTVSGIEQRIRSRDFYEMLLAQLTRLSQADVIAVIDNTGRVVNSTTQWPPTGTYARRSRLLPALHDQHRYPHLHQQPDAEPLFGRENDFLQQAHQRSQ